MPEELKHRCFVIMPIGDEGTDTRKRADNVLDYIIRPAAEECGYEVIRADQISKPGVITTQIIQHLIDDELVVADLSGGCPNVFYELAVRHVQRKAIVQIIEKGETIPFDVAPIRTIFFDPNDLRSADQCRGELVKQIKAVETDPTQSDNPITQAVDRQALKQSSNPLERSVADVLEIVQEIRAMVSQERRQSAKPPTGVVKGLMEMAGYPQSEQRVFNSMADLITGPKTGQAT